MHHRELVSPDRLAAEALPLDYATRWGPARKAKVVEAVEAGLLRLDEALSRYRLSIDEFRSWQGALHRLGVKGLRQRRTRVGRFGRKRRGPALPPPLPHLV